VSDVFAWKIAYRGQSPGLNGEDLGLQARTVQPAGACRTGAVSGTAPRFMTKRRIRFAAFRVFPAGWATSTCTRRSTEEGTLGDAQGPVVRRRFADRRGHDGDDVQDGKTLLVQWLTVGLRTSLAWQTHRSVGLRGRSQRLVT
jgi:hypothetical protein